MTNRQEPHLHRVQCLDSKGLHQMAYWEWGDAANPHVVVCVHGLSRQGRDFDSLASALSQDFRVIAPDVVGRGQSDWLTHAADYQLPLYVADMVTLIARLNVDSVSWVGTSMGGLIGLGLASLPQSPVKRLVLNDVGPTIPAQALERIAKYLGMPMRWSSVQEAADYMLGISPGFGVHTPQQWLELSRPMVKPDGNGFKLHYDPNIAVPFNALTPELAKAGEAALWKAYDALACPTLLLRGAESNVLARETALAMTQRGPKARLHEFANVGHAPTLVVPEQVAVVKEFLLSP